MLLNSQATPGGNSSGEGQNAADRRIRPEADSSRIRNSIRTPSIKAGRRTDHQMPAFAANIKNIANEMAVCSTGCAGVTNAPRAGRPPRGLVLETQGRHGSGAIVVGQNPGKAGRVEAQHYRVNGSGYKQQLAAWHALIRDQVAYFVLLRQLLAHLKLDGPILWTDVAKCEGTNPPLGTLMTCSQRYLARELSVIPADWPVIAAGAQAFHAIGFMAGLRPVVGLRHPTGRFSAKGFQVQLEKLANDSLYLAAVRQHVRTPSARVWLA